MKATYHPTVQFETSARSSVFDDVRLILSSVFMTSELCRSGLMASCREYHRVGHSFFKVVTFVGSFCLTEFDASAASIFLKEDASFFSF